MDTHVFHVVNPYRQREWCVGTAEVVVATVFDDEPNVVIPGCSSTRDSHYINTYSYSYS